MPTPGEHKTVQARILAYAEAIGWTVVSREEAEQRRGFDPEVPPADRARNRSIFFDDLLDAKVREFNPRYSEAEGALLGQFRHLHSDIYGNREFVEHLRNRGKLFDHEEKRERDRIHRVLSMGRGATPFDNLNWLNSINCAINAPHKAFQDRNLDLLRHIKPKSCHFRFQTTSCKPS